MHVQNMRFLFVSFYQIVYIKPPWSLRDVLQCLRKHWFAVFGQVVPRRKLQTVLNLIDFFKSGMYSQSVQIHPNTYFTLLNPLHTRVFPTLRKYLPSVEFVFWFVKLRNRNYFAKNIKDKEKIFNQSCWGSKTSSNDWKSQQLIFSEVDVGQWKQTCRSWLLAKHRNTWCTVV